MCRRFLAVGGSRYGIDRSEKKGEVRRGIGIMNFKIKEDLR